MILTDFLEGRAYGDAWFARAARLSCRTTLMLVFVVVAFEK